MINNFAVRYAALIFLLFSPILADGQQQSVQIISLYPESTFITNRPLPFAVVDANNTPLTVTAASLNSITHDNCEILIDKFRRHIVLVACQDQVDELRISIHLQGMPEKERLEIGPYDVRDVGAIGSEPTGENPDERISGSRLFSDNCTNCHSPDDAKFTSTINKSTLKGAFQSVNEMSGFAGAFTDEELDAIIDYLKGKGQ